VLIGFLSVTSLFPRQKIGRGNKKVTENLERNTQ